MTPAGLVTELLNHNWSILLGIILWRMEMVQSPVLVRLS